LETSDWNLEVVEVNRTLDDCES